MTSIENQKTNHVAMVVDASGSMEFLKSAVVKAFDGLIGSLKRTSETFKQETRVSVYLFDSTHNGREHVPNIKVAAFDMDVMRLPSINGLYRPGGGTPLAFATKQAIEDLQKVPALYTDHAFLVYVLTDGEENTSGIPAIRWLQEKLKSIPESWTIVAQVPNSRGVVEMQNLGFSRGNVEIWDTSERGIEEAVKSFDAGAVRYMTARAAGQKVASNYFQVDATQLNAATVKKELTPISSRKFRLIQNPEITAVQIRPLVEQSTGEPYVLGNSYYGLVKTETIQPQKKILVRNKQDGKVYGGDEARELIGLPAGQAVMVRPTLSPSFDIYVQSTSVNRNIIPKQSVVVLR